MNQCNRNFNWQPLPTFDVHNKQNILRPTLNNTYFIWWKYDISGQRKSLYSQKYPNPISTDFLWVLIHIFITPIKLINDKSIHRIFLYPQITHFVPAAWSVWWWIWNGCKGIATITVRGTLGSNTIQAKPNFLPPIHIRCGSPNKIVIVWPRL